MACKIMLVDDEETFLKFLGRLVREGCPGCEVLAFSDGLEAEKSAPLLQPDIILMDVRMPNTDGRDICRRLKNNPATSDIPILLLSGAFTESEHLFTGMESGADGYLCKPFVPSELIGKVRALIKAREETRAPTDVPSRSRIKQAEAIGLLTSDIANDFNNMLTAILGNVALAKTSCRDEQKLHEYLEAAESAAFRAKNIAQQLAGLSVAVRPTKSPIHVAPILRFLVAKLLVPKNLPVRIRLDANLDLALADAHLTHLALESIIEKMLEDSAGDSVEIAAQNFKLPGRSDALDRLKPGQYVQIRIHRPDTKFSEPTAWVANLDLDLPIANSIIRRLTGEIRMRKRKEQIVDVELFIPSVTPIGSAPILSPASQGEPQKASRSPRVLIMDDEEAVRKLLACGLGLKGFDVDVAGCGEAALQMYRDAQRAGRPYQAVLLDLSAPPGMGALETLQHLRQLDSGVRAILCTGYASDPALMDYKAHGFYAAAPKPFNLNDLIEIIKRAIADHPSA